MCVSVFFLGIVSSVSEASIWSPVPFWTWHCINSVSPNCYAVHSSVISGPDRLSPLVTEPAVDGRRSDSTPEPVRGAAVDGGVWSGPAPADPDHTALLLATARELRTFASPNRLIVNWQTCVADMSKVPKLVPRKLALEVICLQCIALLLDVISCWLNGSREDCNECSFLTGT